MNNTQLILGQLDELVDEWADVSHSCRNGGLTALKKMLKELIEKGDCKEANEK